MAGNKTENWLKVNDYQSNVNKAINRCVGQIQYVLVYLNPYN